MNVNVGIIDQQVRALALRLKPQLDQAVGKTLDETAARSVAFVVLCQKVTLGLTEDEALEALTEGGNDFGVDAIDISDISDGSFTVTFFQGKYHHANLEGVKGFEQNAVLKAIQAIRMLLRPDAPDNLNPRLQVRVEEIRSLIAENIPRVRFILCSNGVKWSEDVQQIIDREQFGDRVRFEHVNHDDLVRILQRPPSVKDTLHFAGKSIVEDLNFSRVFIGKLPVSELARLMETHGDGLLDRNIRRFLGFEGSWVNEAIQKTLQSDADRTNFFFYNNGITLTCDRFDYSAFQPENHNVKVDGLQIINGGQTSRTIQLTLAAFEKAPPGLEHTYVLARLYQLPQEGGPQGQTITWATNSQSLVDLKDLRSNDERQKTLELSIRQLGYEYRRQRAEKPFARNEISTGTAAEAVLSVWRRMPHRARFRAMQHFDELYDEIFGSNLNGAQLVLAVLLLRIAENKRRSPPQGSPDWLPYASYFAAMLMGQELLADLKVPLERVDHRNFDAARQLVEAKGEAYFNGALKMLGDALVHVLPASQVSLRKLSATFRRDDLMEFLPRA